jgi:aromatic-L-amino-acid/L-tryptophan decarboxylase
MSDPSEEKRTESGGDAGLRMSPEEMRALGYRAIDALVERWSTLSDEPGWVGGTRAEIDARLGPPTSAPEAPRSANAVLDDAIARILPNAARIDHPRFFAFIPSAPTWSAVLGDLLATGYNVFQGTWLASSGPSRIELEVTDWFRQWLQMPVAAGGVLTSGGSVANLMAVAMARELADNPPDPVVYLSDQGHSSLRRGARIAGIPPEGIRVLETGPSLRLDPEGLREAVLADRAAGRTPILACANGGATNSGQVDLLGPLAAVTRQVGIRFHVDAAYGGFAALDPRGAEALAGIGEADTVTLDPHKWLFQPFECGGLMARDADELHRVFGERADYLQDTELGSEQVNFGDRGVQLSRRFRALKVWMTVQTHGLAAIREGVAHGITLAERAEARIRSAERLELLFPASLGIVLYRYRAPRGVDADRLNREIQEAIVQGGYAMVSSTRIGGVYALRLCILNPRTRWADVDGVLERVERLGDTLVADAMEAS